MLAPLLARLVAGLAAATALSAAASPANHLSPLGINIRDVKYWGTEMPMVDLFKKAGVGGRLWQTQNDTTWDTQEQALLDLDPQGWPRSLPGAASTARYRYATTLLFQGTTRFPDGRYTVLYDGEGTIFYGGGTRNAALSSPGTDIVDVNPAGGQLYVSIRQTDPRGTGNHIRNIRVVPPGGTCRSDPTAYAPDASACPASFRPFTQTYATEPFHPLFLKDIQGFGAIRFIHFTGTNTTLVQEWSQRVQPTVPSWGGQTNDGAPLEVAIELANRADASPWFNVPARASDDYVLQFATLLRNQLTTPKPIYIEYNNETWNGSYPYSIHALWMQANGLARWPSSPLDAFAKQMNWFGMRTSQVCAIVKQVFADQPGRVQCVMGTQLANTGASTSSLDCPLYVAEQAGRAPCHANMDALAVGSYFGDHIQQSRFEPVWRTWFTEPDGGIARLYEEVYTGVIPRQGNPAAPVGALAAIRSALQQQGAIARARSLRLVAYEAGSGFDSAQRPAGDPLAASYESLQDLMVAASRDRRMEAAFKAMLEDWRAEGGDLLMVFSGAQAWSAVAGNAATLEYTGQPRSQAPKHDAALNYLAANDCAWAGCDGGSAGSATATTIAFPALPAAAGSPFTLTATVSGASATGVVSFTADGLSIPGCEEVPLGANAECTTSSLAAGSRSIAAAYSGDGTHRRSRSAPATLLVAPAGPSATRLSNISTRGRVLTGADVMIGGFIIGGSRPKTVVVRARGPSLTAAGVPGALGNPVLQLFSGATPIATNDDWSSAANAAEIASSGFAPSNPLESAIHATLAPGAYTAIVTGAGGSTGVGIVEVFEVDLPDTPLVNLSTRGQVLTGADVLIGGFTIQGDAPQTVVVRARGPSLAAAGVPGALANPVLQLFSGATPIASNDDWQVAANAAAILASGFAPSNPNEAALLITLAPGAYTAIVTGAGNATGVGIIEVFAQ